MIPPAEVVAADAVDGDAAAAADCDGAAADAGAANTR